MISNNSESRAFSVNMEQTAQATEYLEKHKIPQLMQYLTSALLFEQPESPKKFLVNELEKIYKAQKATATENENNKQVTNKQESGVSNYFSDSNLQSLFQIYDRNNRGFISLQEYLSAMGNLHLKTFNKEPKGASGNKIDENTFVSEAKAALSRLSFIN